jgi:hypothetical protein
MSNVEKLIFWRKISKISVFICGVGIILNILFKQYAVEYRLEILILGIVVISIYLYSNLMRFILRKRINSN